MFRSFERDGRAILQPISSPLVSPISKASKPRVVSPIENATRRRTRPVEDEDGTSEPDIIEFGEQWMQASYMLKKNPSLVTRRVLFAALQHSPPVELISFMLSVNPDVASIPKEGPTALQVAVTHKAGLEVIRILIDACPFALCATNPGHPLDPLTYAKRYRSEDKALVDLLRRPLSYWMAGKGSRTVELIGGVKDGSVEFRGRNPNSSVTNHTLRNSRQREEAKQVEDSHGGVDGGGVDGQDITNVKLLCAQVLKGHKKMIEKMNEWESEMLRQKKERSQATKTTASSLDVSANNTALLEELKKQEKKFFRLQLIALDMKERAFKAQVKDLEQTGRSRLEESLLTAEARMATWQHTTEAKLNQWRVILDHEVGVNARFRGDVGQFMQEVSGNSSESSSFPSSIGHAYSSRSFGGEDSFGSLDVDDLTPLVNGSFQTRDLVEDKTAQKRRWTRFFLRGEKANLK